MQLYQFKISELPQNYDSDAEIELRHRFPGFITFPKLRDRFAFISDLPVSMLAFHHNFNNARQNFDRKGKTLAE